MRKYSFEDKIDIYKRRKNGDTLKSLSLQCGMTVHNIQYLVWLVDKHGFDILIPKRNRNYSKKEKERIINRILLNNESIQSVAVDEGLPSEGMLHTWVKKYKENGYNIVERKRGRSAMPKVTKKKENETKDETIKRLEEENLYLKAELEYSKKLRAVVQARKNQQQKKK